MYQRKMPHVAIKGQLYMTNQGRPAMNEEARRLSNLEG
jgi:hypothetical protein